MIVGVILSNTTREFDKVYSYKIEENHLMNIQIGLRVLVPFGRADRTREGLVVKIDNLSNDNDISKIKSIIVVLDKKPIITSQGLKLALWMKKRYICTYYDAIYCMIPAGTSINIKRFIYLKESAKDIKLTSDEEIIVNYLKEQEIVIEQKDIYKIFEKKKVNLTINSLLKKSVIDITEEYEQKGKEKTVQAAFLKLKNEEALELVESDKLKNIKKIKIIEILMENEFIPISELINITAASRSIIKNMAKDEILYIKDVIIERNDIFKYKSSIYNKKVLTSKQNKIFKKLYSLLEKDTFEETLFYGITGSGKSEVYMHLIEQALDKGKDVIVLVPEIALTAQMLSMFATRFGEKVALIHSKLSIGERFDQWNRINEGKSSVVLGTRSAIFSPIKNLGLVIIDEEHDGSYKSDTVPRYHAADIARKRCIDNNGLLVLGSATPRIESFYRANKNRIDFLTLEERVINSKLPNVKIVDMKTEITNGKYNNLSYDLKREILETLNKNEQIMLLLNRRGYARILACNSCGYIPVCPNCSITLTYHTSGERLICHYCGFTRKKTNKCIKCDSTKIIALGTGTQQIEEELDKYNTEMQKDDQLGIANIIKHERMDLDTTAKKNSVDKILNDFRKNKFNTLIGTQMIAKGHDIHNVTLVGILSADMILTHDDFRANEKTFQLITQAAGRAGRGEKAGKVLVQCIDTGNYSIKAALNHDYREFYKTEIQIREKLEYPPFTNIGQIIVSGKNNNIVKKEIEVITFNLKKSVSKSTEVIGPAMAPIFKINDRYRWRIIIKERDFEVLLNTLTVLYDKNSAGLKKKGIRLLLDINPFN